MKEITRDQSIDRLETTHEVAAAVLWLCSPAASSVVGVGLPASATPSISPFKEPYSEQLFTPF